MNENKTSQGARGKAVELVEKFKPFAANYANGTTLKAIEHNAKQCALICCDEILKSLEEFKSPIANMKIKDYEQVRNEIQSL